MKKTNYTLILFGLLFMNLLNAQEESESKFNLLAYGSIGYGIVENDNAPNYNMNSNNGELLLNYNISDNFGIASGIGLNELSGSGFNAAGSFYHERSLLKIPVLATMDYSISESFSFVANLGVYTQNILKDEYRFLNTIQKDVYEGWNYGVQMGMGFMFNAFDNFSLGIHYNGQSDFTKFKTSNDQPFNDEQKMRNLSTFGIIVAVKL